MSLGKRGRGRPRKDLSQIVREQKKTLSEKDLRIKYKKLQLYYYFTIGREYLSSDILADYERERIRKKLHILDKLNIPHILGSEKILSPANMTDWFENLYQYRFELQRLRIGITRKTRLAGAAQRVVRLFGLDILRVDRIIENGRLEYRYRGASPHSAADMSILNEWLERDRQAAQADEIARD